MTMEECKLKLSFGPMKVLAVDRVILVQASKYQLTCFIHKNKSIKQVIIGV
jgi:hypothetical protein